MCKERDEDGGGATEPVAATRDDSVSAVREPSLPEPSFLLLHPTRPPTLLLLLLLLLLAPPLRTSKDGERVTVAVDVVR